MRINEFQGFIFDLDGVLWLGDTPVEGVAPAIEALRSAGRSIRFLTNNASQHRSHQCMKLQNMGVTADISEVITAGSATATHLLQTFGSINVHVMGTKDLEQEMRDAGHRVVGKSADAVVVGFDKEFNYQKLKQAFRNLYVDGARFVACNENAHYPAEDGVTPGNGASVAALAYCSGRSPEIVVGKPEKAIFDITLESIGLPASTCAMVADLLELDIKGAQAVGMGTIFVLSGLDKQEDIERTGISPDYVLASAADITLG
jgi:4-nitrophenyl phosphatase